MRPRYSELRQCQRTYACLKQSNSPVMPTPTSNSSGLFSPAVRSEARSTGGSQMRPESASTAVTAGLDTPFGFVTRRFVTARLSLTRPLWGSPLALSGPLGGEQGRGRRKWGIEAADGSGGRKGSSQAYLCAVLREKVTPSPAPCTSANAYPQYHPSTKFPAPEIPDLT